MTKKRSMMSAAAIVLALLLGSAAGVAEDRPQDTKNATFTIEGMTCGGCVGAVKVQLKRTAGVKEFTVSYEEAQVEVTYDPQVTDPEAIAESITQSGFKATVKEG